MFLNYNVLFQLQIIPRKTNCNLSGIHIIKIYKIYKKNFSRTYLVIFFDNHEANWPKKKYKSSSVTLISKWFELDIYERLWTMFCMCWFLFINTLNLFNAQLSIATSNMTSEPSFFSFIHKEVATRLYSRKCL